MDRGINNYPNLNGGNFMKNKIRLEMHEKLMNKSQYFENKIYYGISFDELYPICKKYGFDYSTVFDLLLSLIGFPAYE